MLMRPSFHRYVTILFCWLLLAAGCASTDNTEADFGRVPTRTITFSCDRQINQGQLLPVDIIYVARYHLPGAVISIGPDHWFDHIERERWEQRQTLSLSGESEKTVTLNPLWLKETQFLIVYADFKDVSAPYPQQIVLDETADKKVRIMVMPRSLALGEFEAPWYFPCLGWF